MKGGTDEPIPVRVYVPLLEYTQVLRSGSRAVAVLSEAPDPSLGADWREASPQHPDAGGGWGGTAAAGGAHRAAASGARLPAGAGAAGGGDGGGGGVRYEGCYG